MRYRVRDMKARAEELLDGYQDARDHEFNLYIRKELEEWSDDEEITEEDLVTLVGSFKFPEEGDWAWDAVQSEIEDVEDQRHEQMRDERMGL